MQPKHALIALGIVFVVLLEIWEPETSKGLVRTATRLIALLMSCVFLYQSYQAWRSALFDINTEGSAPVANPEGASSRFAAGAWGTVSLALALVGISMATGIDLVGPIIRLLISN